MRGCYLPVRGKKRQRISPVGPLPAWWGVRQRPGGVWGLAAPLPAGWQGSTWSGRDPCETAPGSAPIERSASERDTRAHPFSVPSRPQTTISEQDRVSLLKELYYHFAVSVANLQALLMIWCLYCGSRTRYCEYSLGRSLPVTVLKYCLELAISTNTMA